MNTAVVSLFYTSFQYRKFFNTFAMHNVMYFVVSDFSKFGCKSLGYKWCNSSVWYLVSRKNLTINKKCVLHKNYLYILYIL